MRHSYTDLRRGLGHGTVLETVEPAKLGAEDRVADRLCRPIASSSLCEKLCVAAMCRRASGELVQAPRRGCTPVAAGVAAAGLLKHSVKSRDEQLRELLAATLQADELEAFGDGDIEKLVGKRYFSPATFRHASRAGLTAALPDAPGLVDILMVKVAVPIAGGPAPSSKNPPDWNRDDTASGKEQSRFTLGGGTFLSRPNALASPIPVPVQRDTTTTTRLRDLGDDSSPAQSVHPLAGRQASSVFDSNNNLPGPGPGGWPSPQLPAPDVAPSMNRAAGPWPGPKTTTMEFEPSPESAAMVPLDRVSRRAKTSDRYQQDLPPPLPGHGRPEEDSSFSNLDAAPGPTTTRDRAVVLKQFDSSPAATPPAGALLRKPMDQSRQQASAAGVQVSDEEWCRTCYETYLKPPLLLYRRVLSVLLKMKLMWPRLLKSVLTLWRSLRGPRVS